MPYETGTYEHCELSITLLDGQIRVMRKTRIITLAGIAFVALAACGGEVTGQDDENVVNVYNWADYIELDVIDQFEAETGIKVNYDTI